MILNDLNEIAFQSKTEFTSFKRSNDLLLSDKFKFEFKLLLEETTTEKISFSKYTSTVITQTGLTIDFPNQWFIIAYYFVPFAKELKKYKEHFSIIFKDVPNLKDVAKKFKESAAISDNYNQIINDYFEHENDRLYFKNFISNYNWWFGSKYINRTDYYVSPILNLANVVNDSQAYIAEITYKLTESQNVYEILKSHIIIDSKSKDNNKYEILLYETDSIRDFALYVFKYFYNNSWTELLLNSEVKSANINDLSFNSFDFGVFKRLIAEFNIQVNKDILTSGGTLRYFEEPIFEKENKFYFFSTQWNGDSQRDLNFIQLKQFFEDNNHLYKLHKVDKIYKLVKIATICDLFLNDVKKSGLIFSSELIKRFIASLCAKQFLILTGLSGSGKTKLAQAFAKWISESPNQYLLVPVGADWTNREPLLGYPNSLEPRKYVTPESGVIQIISDAIKNPEKPYFLILDEMNLSHVERYFADFLSSMESKESIKLYSDSDRYTKFDTKDNPIEDSKVFDNFRLPLNLFIIGTVNIDETTYMFSPKVLDRANTIEFRLAETDLDLFFQNTNPMNLSNLHENYDELMPGLGLIQSETFIDLVNKSFDNIDYSRIADVFKKFFSKLKIAGAEFGYRSINEISRLVGNLEYFGSNLNEAIDFAVMQKLLPKLHGSRSKMVRVLPLLADSCMNDVASNVFLDEYVKGDDVFAKHKDQIIYPVSLEKICRMYKNALDNGFTSYAEA